MLTAMLLVAVAVMGAPLVLLSSDTGTGSPLFVAAALVAAILLAVGYVGFRVAVSRFGASPSRDATDDDAASRSQGADDPASADTLQAPDFTRTQQVRGLVLLGAFVVLRAILARAWDRYFPGGYSTDPLFLAFLGGIFLLLSVGLVYFGFTRWVGVDLRRWWVDRQRLRGDLLWGVAGIVLVLAATLGGTLALTALFPGLAPVGEAGADPSPTVSADAASGFAVNLLLGWFFGFAIAAFQEETCSVGFSRISSRSDTGVSSRSSDKRVSSRSLISGITPSQRGHYSSSCSSSASSLDGSSTGAGRSSLRASLTDSSGERRGRPLVGAHVAHDRVDASAFVGHDESSRLAPSSSTFTL